MIDNDELAKIWHINADGDMPGFRCALIDGRYRVHGGGEALAAALERVRREVLRGDRAPARGSSSCPTATATRTTRRSRRCC